jgi:hypothetical protein
MKELLQSKLDTLNYNLNNDIIAEEGLMFMLGQQELLIRLLDECVHIEFNYDTQEYYDSHYYDDADEFYSDPLEDYYSDLAMYKHEEISDMYNKHYHYSWWIGKNVMSLDNYWFTSDEIEAFREIWQRRVSA